MAGKIQIYDYTVNLLQQVGRGAMGTVFMGCDKDGNTVAVKQVSKNDRRKASAEAVRFHFLKQKVSYEYIVEVHDVKTWKDSMWIVMEYCDLGDLNKFFDSHHHSIDMMQKIGIMRQIASGIDFLHLKDIVHRDIKPANILMKSDPTGPRVKLGDFGLSKFLDPHDETSSMSSDVGTLLFKAPEFWNKSQGERVRYHRNVDVYAAGLTFMAMIQAQPGHNLIPEAEGSLLQTETSMPIGFAAFTRSQNRHAQIQVVLTRIASDPPLIRQLKTIIEKMTYLKPEARMSAADVEERMCELEEQRLDPPPEPTTSSVTMETQQSDGHTSITEATQ